MTKRLNSAARTLEPALPILAYWVVEDRVLKGELPKGGRVIRDYLLDRSSALGQWGGVVVIVHRLARGPRDFVGVIRDVHSKEVIGRVERDEDFFPALGRTYPRDRLVFCAGGGV